MKNTLLSILVVVFFFLFMPQQALAHFAATDGDITVVLHVDPNDAPIPGQQAHLYFLFNFNDQTKKFHLNACNCVVTITETQNTHSYQQRLIQKDNPHLTIWGANMPFVFPQRDVYKIALIGKPLSPNAFKPFSLTWFFRVDSNASGIVKQAQPQLSDIQQLLIALAVVIIFLVGMGLFIRKEMQLSKTTVDNRKKR